MDLEQRVKILEEEIQILKNQIQATLLDIQENLLTQAHPELKPGNMSLSDPIETASGRPSIITFSADNQADNTNTEPPKPMTRKVNTDPVRPAAVSVPAPQVSPATTPQAASSISSKSAAGKREKMDWATMAELEAWASNQVGRIGPERTRTLIKRYAEEGRFTRHVRDDLLSLVATYEEVINERSVRSGVDPVTPVSWPNSAIVPAATQSNAASESTPQPPVPKTGKNTKVTSNVQAAPRTTAPIPPEDTHSSQLVLRLIAGVHNASAGIQWRKRNG